MAILPADQRSQIMLLLTLAALAGGYFFWTKKHTPDSEQISTANAESDSLERIIAAAKRDLASGSIEDLRRRVEEYQGSLELMRRLVPERNEVPTLIDDISTKAKVRGITLGGSRCTGITIKSASISPTSRRCRASSSRRTSRSRPPRRPCKNCSATPRARCCWPNSRFGRS